MMDSLVRWGISLVVAAVAMSLVLAQAAKAETLPPLPAAIQGR